MAQFGCVDSVRANPLYQCNDQFYNPVCGCNGVTYRNQCNALNVHGVTNWVSGVCSGFDVDYYPNPVGPASAFTVNLSFPETISGNMTLRIVDMYGKTAEQRFLSNFNRIQIEFYLQALRTGIYHLVVQDSRGFVRTFTFSKF